MLRCVLVSPTQKGLKTARRRIERFPALPKRDETGSELHMVDSAQEADRRLVDSCALGRGFPYSVVRWATRPSVPTMLIARLRL